MDDKKAKIDEKDVLLEVLGIGSGGMIDLKKVPNTKADGNVAQLLVQGEKIIGVYQTVRDQLIFTNMRLISVDVKNMIGARKEYFSLPYSKVQYFGVQTAGALEFIADSELTLVFTNGMTARFEFQGKNDILEIGRVISSYALR